MKEYFRKNKRIIMAIVIGGIITGSGAAVAPSAIPAIVEILCQVSGGCL